MKKHDLPYLLYNQLHDCWTSYALRRQGRPNDFQEAQKKREQTLRKTSAEGCPFCPNRIESDKVISSSSDGHIVILENKFPAVDSANERDKPPSEPYGNHRMSAFGYHEVVIEDSHHDRPLLERPQSLITAWLQAQGARMASHHEDPAIAQTLLFKNQGERAGASLIHPHSQIVSLPFLAKTTQTILRQKLGWQRDHGGCYLCDLQAHYSHLRIHQQGEYRVYSPAAPRFAFETIILSTDHDSRMIDCLLDPQRSALLAELLQDTLKRIERQRPQFSYNIVFHSAPNPRWANAQNRTSELIDPFHWFIEIIPRTGFQGGFEWATTIFLNSTPPEQAAERLRNG